MPGTIQVSVLDLMDLPVEADPPILKCAMGKREYQNIGKGEYEYTFPVTSLRENLVLMLLDREGKETSRAEFRTMSVVEKGIWDDLFHLDGGGRARIRLQFSLSEEERMRIREMRESVVRMKQSKLLRDVHGITPSTTSLLESGEPSTLEQHDPHATEVNKENTSVQLPRYVVREMEILSQESIVPSSPDKLGFEDSLEQSVLHTARLDKETIQVKSTNVSRPRDPEKSEELDSCIGGTTDDRDSISTRKDKILSSRRKTSLERSSSGNVKKMITAFESTANQRLEPRIDLRMRTLIGNFDSKGSLKRAFSEASNVEKEKVPGAMAKSFSAGMLSEMSSQESSALYRSHLMKQNEKSQNLDDYRKVKIIKNQGSGKQAADEASDVDTSHDMKGVSDVDTFGGTAGKHIEKGPHSTHELLHSATSSHTGEKTNKDPKHSRTKVGDADQTVEQNKSHLDPVLSDEIMLLSKMLDEPVNAVPTSCALSHDQDLSSDKVIKNDERMTSNEDVLSLKLYDHEACASGNFVGWTPHLCITTGSKQLRDLVGCYNVSVHRHFMGNYLFIKEVEEEQEPLGDRLILEAKIEEISPSLEGSKLGSSKAIEELSRGLMGRVVRVVVIIVACGTLLLQTKPRNSRF